MKENGRGNAHRAGLASSARNGIKDRVHAKLFLQAARTAFGPSAGIVSDAFIPENLSVCAITERLGIRREITMGYPQDTFTHLVEY
jgi:hypothetical protein